MDGRDEDLELGSLHNKPCKISQEKTQSGGEEQCKPKPDII